MKKLIPASILGFALGAVLFGTSIVNAAACAGVYTGGTGICYPNIPKAHTVLLGNDSGSISTTSPSTAGYVLTSNGVSADPTFQASSGGSGTVSTSTIPTVGQIAYWTSNGYPSLLGSVGTSTLTASAPITGSFTQVGSGGSLGCTNASSGVTGCLTGTDWNTFNGKQTSLSTPTWPILLSGTTLSFGWATTSQPSSSNIFVSNGTNGFYGVATSTLSASSPLTGSFTQLGSGGTLGIQVANGSQNGYLSSGDWTTFNGKQAALTGTTGQFPYFSGTNTVTATSSLFLATSGNVGIGTTTPTWLTTLASSIAPQLSLSAGAGFSQWTFANEGGNLYISTTTVAGTATSTLPAISIIPNSIDILQISTTTNAGIIKNGSIAFTGQLWASSNLTNANTGDYVCYNTVSGEIEQSATACSLSSLRYKENIRSLNEGLDTVLALRPILYDLKPHYGNLKNSPGFIAEEAVKIVPNLVPLDKYGRPDNFDYPKLTAVIVKAMQDFYAEFQTLVGRVSGLEQKVENQQQEIDSLKARLDKIAP